jgi:DNA-binding NtrC family response regulator
VRVLRPPPEGVDIEQVILGFLQQALERTRGNQRLAGELLGMNRDQVRYRIRKYGLCSSTQSARYGPTAPRDDKLSNQLD